MSWRAVRTVAMLELRQRVRSTRWRVMLIIWGVVLAVLCTGMFSLAGYTMGVEEMAYIAPHLYDLTLCFVLGIGLIVAPTLSATSINGDRADATLALLQATALRSQEIVAGKLVAAWAAALAFLAVALPFLAGLMMLGGATFLALCLHLLVLIMSFGAVCAIGLGFSAATARTSASSVLTYLVVAALVVGTPLLTAISSSVVRIEQVEFVYTIDFDNSTDARTVCEPEPQVLMHSLARTDRIWWMLVPNPFAALADISARTSLDTSSSFFSLGVLPLTGLGIDTMRNPVPDTVVSRYCDVVPGEDVQEPVHDTEGRDYDEVELHHVAFWPVTLGVLALIGAWPLVSASRRLRTPARTLARGTRVA